MNTNKINLIKAEVERLKSNLIHGACSSQIAMETMCKEEAYNEILAIIDSMQEEPVSEELENELNKYIKDYFTIDREQLDRFGIEEKDYMYSMDKSDMLALVEHFTKWQKEQMMAKAIDGKVIANGMGNPILHLWDKGKHLIDKKVKVILINED